MTTLIKPKNPMLRIKSLMISTTIPVLLSLVFSSTSYAVNVALVDSGTNPGVLGGSLEPGGKDFVNNDDDPSDDTANQHGTAAGHVAINSGTNVTLTSIKAFGPSFNTSTEILDAAFNYIATLDSARVVAHTGASISNTSVSALQNAAFSGGGKIIVFQAGNFGGANPAGDAQKAGALDGLGIIAGGQDYAATNRAGNMKDFYIVAPTRAIINGLNGTSMATPRVAATAATIMHNHPFIDPKQVVRIIFQSADDLGAPGVDEVFGHGALNAGAALSQVGTVEMPSSGGGGGGGGIAAAALVLGGGWAYSYFRKDKELKRTLILDEFGRGFNFDLKNSSSVRNSQKPSVFAMLDQQTNETMRIPLAATENSITLAMVSEREVTPHLRTAFDAERDTHVQFMHEAKGVNSNYTMAFNTDLSGNFGALTLAEEQQDHTKTRFFSNDLFTTPVLGYSAQGSAFQYGWTERNHTNRFGVSVIDDQTRYGQQSNSVLYESSVEKEKYRIGAQVGALLEDGSLLGGASDSVLGVDSTNTYYLGLNGTYQVSDRLSVLGGLFQGISTVEESRNGLMSDFSTIRSQGYALGLLMSDVFNEKGSIGVAISSPMQTTKGSARLTLPVSQNAQTGEVSFEDSDLSFDNGDKEKIFEAYYNYSLNQKNNVFTHLSFTKNPASQPDMSEDKAIFVGWKRSF